VSQRRGSLRLVLSPADRTLGELAARQDGIFTLRDARSAGLTRAQIDRRVRQYWVTMHDGVFRTQGAPDSWRGRMRAATAAAAPHGAISHRSGAEIFELPGRTVEFIELTCRRWLRAKHPELRVHESTRLDERDITTVDGIRVTTPERTILDLASCFPSDRYLEYVVQAARRKRLITYESMRATFDRHARRGLKGVRALRATLDNWDPTSRPTESDMETMLLHTLRSYGLPEPTLQFDVHDRNGLFLGRVDAAYPAARIAIEYDSKQEHSDEFQRVRDARRNSALQARGDWKVLSARHDDLKRGAPELCREIELILRRITA
jgi:very-short-patch-repair endonuclease